MRILRPFTAGFLFLVFAFILAARPAPAAPTGVLVSAATSKAFEGCNARRITRDSAGNLYLSYYKGAPSQIYVSKSTDSGATWNDMGGAPIQDVTGYSQAHPSIAVDSADNLHVMWSGPDAGNSSLQIKYSKYAAGSWSAWTNVSVVTGYDQATATIAIDSQDNLHVVWHGTDPTNTANYQIKYSKYSAGSWSAWTNIQEVPGYTQTNAALAIDSQNNLHVAWTGTDSGYANNQIKYSKYSGGSWSAWTNIQPISGYTQEIPSIAVDSQDNVHVVWSGTDSGSGGLITIKYSKYSGGSWSPWITIHSAIPYPQNYPNIAIDYQDRLHVFWHGLDAVETTYRNIKYSNCASACDNSANWSAWVRINYTSTAHFEKVSVRWSRWHSNWGNLDWGFVAGGTNVRFYKNTNYKMPDWTPPTPPATVNDGAGADIDTTDLSTQFPANWSAASDPQSSVAKYWVALGTSPGATNTVNWTDVGAATGTTLNNLNLVYGQTYYFSVKAENPTGAKGGATSSDGVTIVPPTVSAGSMNNSTAYNTSRKIVRDSAGNLYFAYHKVSGAFEQIFVSKSSDNGATWADIGGAPIQNVTGYSQDFPAIAIDSADNLHVVWYGKDAGYPLYYQIKYSKYNGSSWSAWTNIQSIPDYDQSTPSISADSADNLHVVWRGRDAGNANFQIKYSKYSGGSWSAWTNIQPISGYDQTYPSIAVDSADNLHVVWYGDDAGNTQYQIKYSKYSGGSWSAWANISVVSGYWQYYPSIAIDSQDNLHVVWGGTDAGNGAQQIKYSKYSGGSWSAWTNIQLISGYNQYDPSIAADYQNRLHVLWYGADAGSVTYSQIKYSSLRRQLR